MKFLVKILENPITLLCLIGISHLFENFDMQILRVIAAIMMVISVFFISKKHFRK
ncbi:MAG: hypothetical protein ACRC28_07110 [Clostridium sp.]|uniref:hypothetical protein n=1 Tax=Clostridium sp. TaxID=1506 RepID=UPI003F2BEC55